MNGKPPILDQPTPPEKPLFYWHAYRPPVWTTILTALAFAGTVVDCFNDSAPIGAVIVVFLVALAIDRWLRWTRHWREDDSPPLPLDSRIAFGLLAVLMTAPAAFMVAVPIKTPHVSLGAWLVWLALGLPFAFIAYLIWQPVGLHFLPRRRKHNGR